MTKVRLISQKRMNHVISHLPGVVDAVRDEAEEIQKRAETKLTQHRKEGHLRVSLETTVPDTLVILEDRDTGRSEPAAHAIEFGHKRKDGTFQPGLYIISGGLNGRG